MTMDLRRLRDVHDHPSGSTGQPGGTRSSSRPRRGRDITENDRPVARLIPVPIVRQRPPRPRPPVTGVPKAGQDEGRLVVPDDFKEPLEDMKESMV
ncbi:MAG: hypothetical protein ABSH35_32710 [Isosphaeraceae bacterium]